MTEELANQNTQNTPAISKPTQNDVWPKVVSYIKQELSEQSFKTWIGPVRFIKIESGILYLEVPDKFYADWLRERYQDIIRGAVQSETGEKPDIHYLVADRSYQPSKPTPPPSGEKKQGESHLNNRYTFDNFVVGPGNRFAHAAALAVSQAPAKNYNPLFIYGSVGLGKTHLMQSVAHHILIRNPQTKVVYMSGEKFTNQLISAIQNRTTHAFRTRYRNTDVLLVDDIHFIAGKESTQEEFFHTFNTLYDNHKQIIVCSDRPPREIPSLEDRLVSRFGWGLVADIQPPDFETRVAILKKKMERETVSVPDEVVHFIASKIKTNIRELEGALIRVVAYASLTGGLITKKVVGEEILRDCLKEEMVNVTIDRIQKCVCEYFGIGVSDLRVKSRSRSIAHPRQIAMYLVRHLTDHSLPEIGGYFGGRGHATVIHACNKIDAELKSNTKTQKTIEDLKVFIQEG